MKSENFCSYEDVEIVRHWLYTRLKILFHNRIQKPANEAQMHRSGKVLCIKVVKVSLHKCK